MNTSAAQTAKTGDRSPTLFDRFIAAVPVVGVVIAVLTFYGIEAWARKTPWVWTDEAEWTQISRAIATTGHAARRTQPIFFKSIYAYLIAPAWWIHSTATAYAVIRYLNVVVMTLAAVPTYLLARMLVSRRSAAAVALLAIAIPGMSYAPSIVTEVLAYPWYALSSWLIVRALAYRRWPDIVLAIAASIGGCFVRWTQFSTIPIAFAIAAGGLWLTGPRGRAMRAPWSRRDKVGAAVLFYGALVFINRYVLQHVSIWQIATEHEKNKMADLGLQAILALVVGIGILPFVAGLASLRIAERRGDPVYRAFAAYAGATILCVSIYAAIKTAYLSAVFSTLIEERNLIYLSPLLLLGTAMLFESRRVNWPVVAIASVFVIYIVLEKPAQLLFPYYEAPGFAVLSFPYGHWGWGRGDIRLALLGVLAVALLLLAWRRRRGVAVITAILLGAWMLAGEIATTVAYNNVSNFVRGSFDKQANWVDIADHGQPATILGQTFGDPGVVLSTEFWNRSIQHVEGFDNSTPGPGPTSTPQLVSADGTLTGIVTPYVVAYNHIYLQGKVIANDKRLMVLYKRIGKDWKLYYSSEGVYGDLWAGHESAWNYFKAGQKGTVLITLSRQAVVSGAPVAHATIVVGAEKVNEQEFFPEMGRVFARRHVLVRDGSLQTIAIPVARTPIRVQLTITPTFRFGSDSRDLGAQVLFKFVPSKG